MNEPAWFQMCDVPKLVAATDGYSLLPGADLAILTTALNDAFDSAAFHACRPLTAAQRAAEMAAIQKSASDLLLALGYATKRFPIPSPRRRRIRGRISDAHHELSTSINFASRQDGSQVWASEHLQAYVDEARESVSAILFAAMQGKRLVEADPSSVGRLPSSGLDVFYTKLAPVFLAMFGCRPPLSGKAPDPQEAAPLWSKAIGQIIEARRLGRRLDRGETKLTQDLRGLKTHSAHSKRMAVGWRSWTAQGEDLRWPPHVWWDFGVRVPKWLPIDAIPAPLNGSARASDALNDKSRRTRKRPEGKPRHDND